MGLRHLAATLALTALLAPRARAAASFGADLPAQLAPGQEIVLRWSDLPPAVDEVEILLSLDGGHSFPLRVSPELDARSGEHRWRVPAIQGEHVRLQLRMGTRDAELPGPASRAFRIAGFRGMTAGWVTRTGRFGDAVYHELPAWSDYETIAARPAALHPPEERLAAADPSFAQTPPEPLALDLPRETGGVAVASSSPCGASAGRAPTSAPRHLPLRI